MHVSRALLSAWIGFLFSGATLGMLLTRTIDVQEEQREVLMDMYRLSVLGFAGVCIYYGLTLFHYYTISRQYGFTLKEVEEITLSHSGTFPHRLVQSKLSAQSFSSPTLRRSFLEALAEDLIQTTREHQE